MLDIVNFGNILHHWLMDKFAYRATLK